MFGIGRIKKYSHMLKLYYGVHYKNAGRKKVVSIMDILLSNVKNGELLRLDVVVGYMAIEGYYNGKKDWDVLYKKMLGTQSADILLQEAESVRKGINFETRVLLDKDFNIISGIEQLAAVLYNHKEQIPVRIFHISEKADYSIHWLMARGFSNDELKGVLDRANELMSYERLKNRMVAVIWNTVAKYKDEIKEDIGLLQRSNIDVKDVSCIAFRHREDYENMVRRIYSVDDVEEWKIEKKIEHMKNYNPEMMLLELDIKDPQFRIKSLSHMPTSAIGEQLKYALRNRYKGRVDDYYFDIVFHMADNYTQSGFINGLIFHNIKMEEIVFILGNYKYAFMKVNSPGVPKEFPTRIPVGKDIDVLIRKEDAIDIKNNIIAYLENVLNDTLQIRVASDNYSMAIRIEMYDRLIFQIDLVFAHFRLDDTYIIDALNRRRCITCSQSYYVLSNEDEYLYRLVAFRENPRKRHHFEYLVSKYKDYSKEALKQYCNKDRFELLSIMKYIDYKAHR